MRVNFCHLWILFVKNLRLLIRSPGWLIMQMIFPILPILYCALVDPEFRIPASLGIRRSGRGFDLRHDYGLNVVWSMEDNCCNAGDVNKLMTAVEAFRSFQLTKSTAKEMKKDIMKIPEQRTTPIGLKIEVMDVPKKKLKYKILAGKDYLKTETDSGYGPHLQFYGETFDAQTASTLQYQIDTAFLTLATTKTFHYTTLSPLPRPEKLQLSLDQAYFYVICPGTLLLIIVYTTRNIVAERQTIKPFLSVMGLSTATFYLSHCIFAFVLILGFSLTHAIMIFYHISGFPWSLAIVTIILFSFSATAYAAMLGSLFSSSTTAIQLTLCFWLSMCVTPLFSTPNTLWHTAFASLQSIWPTYALHYIFKYCIAVTDYGVGSWSGLVDSKWTGQATIGPLLILILTPFLMAGIICIFEMRLWRKIGNLCRKKIRDDEKAREEAKLPNADEKFDVDEKNADIVLKDVYKKYPSGVKAVNGLDMMALRGQVTVLLGHNGAGKTTTFSMICGVEEASAGSVEVGGYPAGSAESHRTIGYCAQVNTLIDQMTVKDHLWLAHGLKRAEGKYWDEGKELLETLGLENKRVKKLSGGQKRKLCVAMALIGNSRVVLLDEPTAGMDPESRRDVEKLLEEVKKERTILLTTHYMDEAETLGDRIFIMADGHGVCSGSPQFLKKRFGTGYLLTLVAAEGSSGPQMAKEMEPLVQKYAASAKLGEIRGKQVEITIPIEEQRHFPALFERIENSQQELHISSFGLSLNSLEQVFLRVCSLTDDKDKSKREATLDDTLAELYEEKKREGCALYFHQFLAVLIKKFIYTIRFWSQLITEIGLPLLCIIAGLVLYTFSDFGQTDLAIKTPTGEKIFMQYETKIAEVDNFAKLGAHTIKNGVKIGDYVRKNLDKQFLMGAKFVPSTYFGGSGSGTQTELFYNALFPLAAAEAINTLSRIRAPDCSISLSLDVFDNSENTNNFFKTYAQSILLFFLITTTICQLVVTIIEDRVSRFAHQQLLTGMKPTIYWLGEVAYCLLIFCFQATVYVSTAAFTGIIGTGTAIKLMMILLLYFWSTIPTVFALSRFINSSSKGALLLWVLLFGSMILLNVLVLMLPTITKNKVEFNLGISDLGKMTGWDKVLLIIRLICPSYTIVELMAIFVNYRNGTEMFINIPDPEGFIAMLCICLAITGAVGLIFFLLVQQHHIRYGIFRIFKAPCGRCRIPKDVVVPQDSIRNQPEGQAMLETVDMSKVYGKKCALAHLNLSVRTHEIFGLLGVSGAGKTTAFNILTGQMFATKGTATIDGIDCRKKVVLGFCPQFDAIHKDFTGREALKLLARIHGYTDPKKTVDRVLDMVKMGEHGKKRMGRCSGGQKRRISVAASLLTTKSRIIILDEATAGIDPKARRDIWEVISAARNHAAVLMTSHSMDECEALCNRIGILKQGGLAIVGTSQSLKSRYGNFYTLTMALPSSEMKSKVTEEVAAWFPGSILKSDGFSLHLKWQVPKKATDRWSTVFASCIQLSERIGVADFCLAQSTLQDIFLLLAGDNPIPLKDVSIHEQTKPTTATATRNSNGDPTEKGTEKTTDKLSDKLEGSQTSGSRKKNSGQ